MLKLKRAGKKVGLTNRGGPGGRRPGAGRPKGSVNKPKWEVPTDLNLVQLARSYTVEAIEILIAVARDLEAPHAARIAAAAHLLDRGHGRPPQAVNVSGMMEHAGTVKHTHDISAMTPQERLDTYRQLIGNGHSAASVARH
jgi:hypothetical protein